MAYAQARRWLVLALAGRSAPWAVAGAVLALAGLVLACLGALLALPGAGPGGPAVGQAFMDAAGFAAQVQQLVVHWSASPAMRWASGLFVGVDTLLFVPAWALVLSGLRRRWCGGMPGWLRAVLRWRRWRWLLVAAVGADLAENGLLWLAAQGQALALALQAASLLKWGLVAAMALAVLAGLLARAAAASAGLRQRRLRRLLEGLRDAARYLWAHAIPLAMLFGGLLLLVGVPQTREIMVDLGDAASGPASRLTTLTLTGVLLVVWIGACGFAFALVGQVFGPWGLRRPHRAAESVAVLQRSHQLLTGLAALVATNVVLVRMSAASGAALSVFIVVGSIGLWVVTARACGAAFRVLGLPRHRRAQPVAWRTVAWLMGLYLALLVGARFMPAPSEALLRAWGLYRPPDGVWRFNAGLVDPQAFQLLLVSLSVAALFTAALGVLAAPGARRGRRPAAVLFAAGLLAWLWTAWQRLGPELLAVQAATLVGASLTLWLLTHRTTLAEYEAWQGRIEARLTGGRPWANGLLQALRALFPSLFGRLRSRLVRLALGGVALFFLLPHASSALAAETGTLAVVFAALAFWGLGATWVLVYLPMRHGLGNWTLAPLAWLALVGLVPRADAPVAPRDNPARLTAMTGPPGGTGNAVAPTLHTHFQAWRQLLPDSQASPVFVVAAAGGGLRAAYWTATLLAELDDRTCGQFGRHVLAASGVSGGSLGVALYAAQRRAWQQKDAALRCATGRAAQMRQVLSGDFLAPIAARLLFADAPLALVPRVAPGRDRSHALSAAVQDRWARAFAQDAGAAGLLALPMREAVPALAQPVKDRPKAPARLAHPVLYLNATAVETGRRVIASNVTLGSMPADPLFYDEPAGRGTRLLTAQTSLLDAALHSARFPVISPAAPVMACAGRGSEDAAGVCTGEGAPYGLLAWGHLLDGGYFENSGLETLGDALQALRQPGPLSVHGALPPVFLVAISNDAATGALCPRPPTPRFPVVGVDPARLASQDLGTAIGESGPSWRRGEAVGGLSATWQALLSVRDGRARLELERMVRRLGCAHVLEWSLGQHLAMARRGPAPGHRADEGGPTDLQEPALGWLLSAASMRRMDEGVARYADAFPFDLAACPARPGPRGLLGSPDDTDVVCRP